MSKSILSPSANAHASSPSQFFPQPASPSPPPTNITTNPQLQEQPEHHQANNSTQPPNQTPPAPPPSAAPKQPKNAPNNPESQPPTQKTASSRPQHRATSLSACDSSIPRLKPSIRKRADMGASRSIIRLLCASRKSSLMSHINEIFNIGYQIGTNDMSFKEWVLAACSLAGARGPVLYQTARYLAISARRGTEIRQTAVIDKLEEIGLTSNDPRALQLLAQHSYLISEVMETPWRVYAGLKEKVGDPMGADEVMRRAALEYEDPAALQDYASLLMREMDLEGYEGCMSKAASSGDVMACLKLANFYYLTSKGWFPRRGVKVSDGDNAKAIPKPTRTVDPAKSVEEKKPGALGRFFSFLSADVKSHAEYRKLAVDWYELAVKQGNSRAALLLAIIERENGNHEAAWELFQSSRTDDAKEFMPTSQDELVKVWRDEEFRPEVPLQLLDL
ncbi:unnamed protein product [Aspergillus oryzae]|uniref:Unnamed protein product n=1 Tax=Aspergillus oryzae TaxID=5062 RepID=A0AAN4YT38_ASPOZ|nr:unnamed protein product [Aspergillus oryzae]GMG34249.1 unnamed protein product [Aspergillus oryzae]